tara:strand:- start:134 stop:406 length:273 start_codon:yes stop_codon:yes gene_type:complete
MEANNKLIAEFMQKGSKSLGIYDFDGCHYRLDELKFHTSWNWLMPVVAKCTELNDDEFDNQSIAWALLSNSIVNVYDQVIEFINEYNQNN